MTTVQCLKIGFRVHWTEVHPALLLSLIFYIALVAIKVGGDVLNVPRKTCEWRTTLGTKRGWFSRLTSHRSPCLRKELEIVKSKKPLEILQQESKEAENQSAATRWRYHIDVLSAGFPIETFSCQLYEDKGILFILHLNKNHLSPRFTKHFSAPRQLSVYTG